MMLIVPETDQLVIEAQIAPSRIDDIHVGQPVFIRFSAFDRSTTPECHGKVERVSPDLIRDSQSRVAYYEARIDVTDKATCLGDPNRLVPGMPSELQIQTERKNGLVVCHEAAQRPVAARVTRLSIDTPPVPRRAGVTTTRLRRSGGKRRRPSERSALPCRRRRSSTHFGAHRQIAADDQEHHHRRVHDVLPDEKVRRAIEQVDDDERRQDRRSETFHAVAVRAHRPARYVDRDDEYRDDCRRPDDSRTPPAA